MSDKDFSPSEILLVVGVAALGALLGYFVGVFIGDFFDRASPFYNASGENAFRGHLYSIIGAMIGTSVGAVGAIFGAGRALWKRKQR